MIIAKHINLLLMAASNLHRYKAKSIAIVVPLILIMATSSFMIFTRGGFIKDAKTAEDFLPDVTVQRVEAGRIGKISLDIKSGIESIPHVRQVIPRVWGYLPLRIDETDVAYTLMGLDLNQLIYHEKLPWAVEAGTFLVPGDRNRAVLGNGVALIFGVGIGDRLQIEDTLGNKGEFEVIGILNNTVQVYSADLIIVSIEDAMLFFDYSEDEASDMLVYTDAPENADLVAWEITRLFKNTRVLTRGALTDLVKEAFGRRGGTFQAMWLILLVTVLLLVWAQSAHISVDVSKEIGILKAIGWQTGEIIEMRMMESLMLGLIGTSIGVLSGFIYALMGTPGISGYCLGCASIYPKFPVPVHCDFQSLVLLFILGVVPLMGVSMIPAWLAGIIDPDEAIRS
ncbi:MAG: FtsX-like permease family protein [Thermodesulfobacteriota bacterium]|nr:FtsX-like permease family protein [Thermodesulfobacteriota bacterium]